MAKITDIIGEANFQIVEMQIASILQAEFEGQNTLREDSFYPTVVYYGHNGAVNENEMPYVSVNWMSEGTNLESNEEMHCSDTYFIDVKAVDRSVTAQIINAVRHILKSNEYYRLGITAGVISRTNVKNVGIDFESETKGAQGTSSGGVHFSVDINEDIPLLDNGVLITELQTNANIGNKTIQFINKI